MTNVARSAGFSFHLVVWLVIAASILMIVVGAADIILKLNWGFSWKDVGMAVVVLAIALILKLIGGKIVSMFGG
jgi:hypothetical protein